MYFETFKTEQEV